MVQQLNAALLFAAGFLVRPLGGWLFGHLADHYGRRSALMLSVPLMCFGSLMIAVTPTYASIGIAAPILLGVARMVQGLSLGGEYGTSATYLTEMADKRAPRLLFELPIRDADRRTDLRAARPAGAAAGVPDPDEIRAWGWRIPFFIGALLAVVALIMRRNLHETDDF